VVRSTSQKDPSLNNHLLAALPAAEMKRVGALLEHVELPFGKVIYDLGDKIEHVYFPVSGIISLLAAVAEVSTLEVGIVGREGLAGLPLFLGVKRSPVKAIVQANGMAMRMSASNFVKECKGNSALQQLLLRFSHSLFTQVSQSAVCFRFHAIEQRLARWLLMTSDRVESNEFRMTQAFLSNMLGVRREAVNRAARSVQMKGMIAYSRSNILIIDRRGLEDIVCKCYSIIRDEEKRIPNIV